jgi:hypothetical protein
MQIQQLGLTKNPERKHQRPAFPAASVAGAERVQGGVGAALESRPSIDARE